MIGLARYPDFSVQDVNAKPALNLRDIRRRFERAAPSFDNADFVHSVTRAGLFTRLEPLMLDAKNVLDLGSATCNAERHLRKRFGRSNIVSLDISQNMLRVGKRKRPWHSRLSASRCSYVQANASRLPFADQSMDLVFSNLMLPCIDRPDAVFVEVARVLRKEGVFAFATLGPDSLLEVSRAWSGVDEYEHVNRFLDMHDIGDAAVRSGLRDPVLDVDHLTVRYENPNKLFADLTSVGARNTLQERNQSLTGKQRFGQMVAALRSGNDAGVIELELELVFGHCWGAGASKDRQNFAVDATHIPLRRG